MISLKKNYDAIVVGAGPAGSSTAALLAEKRTRCTGRGKREISPLSCWGIADAILLFPAGTTGARGHFNGIC